MAGGGVSGGGGMRLHDVNFKPQTPVQLGARALPGTDSAPSSVPTSPLF